MTRAITFVHGIPEIGGAERELLVILRQLSRGPYAVRVIGPHEGPLIEELRRQGITVSHADFPPWRKLFAFPRRTAAVRRLREEISAHPCAIVHVNDIWWVPQVLRAARGLGTPIVAHVRQEIEPSKVSRYELEQVDQVIAISEQVSRSLKSGGVSPERIRVVYSGIDCPSVSPDESCQDARSRLGLPAHALVLGTVANLFPRKGYHVLLQALPRILASVQHAHYLVVGHGNADYERRLHSLSEELRIGDRVHFVGFQTRVSPYLAAMDLYVHPALMEGFGIAVLEAMAMARAVVATAVGGVPEIVMNGETGFLVPSGNPEALASAVITLLTEPEQRARLGLAGRERVLKSFTVEAMMGQLCDAYEVCQRRFRASPLPVMS